MEWLDEEREEREKQKDKLQKYIDQAVDGIDEKFVGKFHRDDYGWCLWFEYSVSFANLYVLDFTEATKGKFDDVREDWDNEIDAMEEKIKKNSLKMTKLQQNQASA